MVLRLRKLYLFPFIHCCFMLPNQKLLGSFVFKILQVWELPLFLSCTPIYRLCLFLLFLFSFKIRGDVFLTTVPGTITTLLQHSFDCLQWSGCLCHIYGFLHLPLPPHLFLLKMYSWITEYWSLLFYFVSATYSLCKWVFWALQKCKESWIR